MSIRSISESTCHKPLVNHDLFLQNIIYTITLLMHFKLVINDDVRIRISLLSHWYAFIRYLIEHLYWQNMCCRLSRKLERTLGTVPQQNAEHM